VYVTTPADLVREACDLLAEYIPRLAPLLPEPDSPAGYGTIGAKGALAHSPVPGNAQAFFAKTSIDGVARWWVAILLYHHGASGPWGRYGGSDDATIEALKAIAQLAAGADDGVIADLLRDLDRARDAAGALRAIDETRQWRRIRNHPCRYCGCFYLEVLLDQASHATTHVECHAAASVGCLDGNGRRPAATLTIDGIAWADGHTETVRRLDTAA
jgi:hypothetical protein